MKHKNAEWDINWKHLSYHAKLCRLYADAVVAHIQKDESAMAESLKALDEFLYRTEYLLNEYLDVYNYRRIYAQYFKKFLSV